MWGVLQVNLPIIVMPFKLYLLKTGFYFYFIIYSIPLTDSFLVRSSVSDGQMIQVIQISLGTKLAALQICSVNLL